jgi:Cysteine-rich secretory protein family
LLPVKLSSNEAAQMHAEDVFRTKQISHWTTNGEKPYMTYTQYDGEGSVQQNVAIAGFSPEQYEQCVTNILVQCEKIEPLSTIEQLQNEMIYNDIECCNDGHRNNILDPHHTHMSIGIVYDQYYLALVQNFENNYGLNIDAENSEIEVSGTLLDGQLDHIAIYYDEMPTREVYEQNKDLLSYSAGELVAMVVKPLPPGYYYESPQGYNMIEANRWNVQRDSINVMFDLADTVDKDGAYTLFAQVKDGEEMFDVTSYSVFVNSEENN